MSLVLLLDFSGVAAEGGKTDAAGALEATETVGMGTLAGMGFCERFWVDAATCVAALDLGEITSGRLPSSQVSAYERFKEAGEDIGGVRTLMELTGDNAWYWLVFHN